MLLQLRPQTAQLLIIFKLSQVDNNGHRGTHGKLVCRVSCARAELFLAAFTMLGVIDLCDDLPPPAAAAHASRRKKRQPAAAQEYVDLVSSDDEYQPTPKPAKRARKKPASKQQDSDEETERCVDGCVGVGWVEGT